MLLVFCVMKVRAPFLRFFNKKIQKLPLCSCILRRNEGGKLVFCVMKVSWDDSGHNIGNDYHPDAAAKKPAADS